MVQKKMTFHEAAKLILQEYEFLHYGDITQIALEKGYIESNGKTPEDTMNAHISAIDKKDNKNAFIRVGVGIYALRKEGEEDNLLTFLKFLLGGKNGFLQLDEKDKKYFFDVFGRDIFENNKKDFHDLLKKLIDSGKIGGYSDTNWGTKIDFEKNEVGDFFDKVSEVLVDGKEGSFVVSLPPFDENKIKEEKQEKKNNQYEIPEKLKKQLEKLTKEGKEFQKLSKKINQDSGIEELTKKMTKFSNDLKVVLPQMTPVGLIEPDTKAFEQFGLLGSALNGFHKNPMLESVSTMISSLEQILKMYDISKFAPSQLEEFQKLQSQLTTFNSFLVNPENFLATLGTANSISSVFLNDVSEKSGKKEKTFTHTFEGYEQEGDFKTIRGYAHIQDLASISKAIYFDNGGVQRNEDKERCLKIKKYIEAGNKRFFPEVILGLYINDDSIKIENSIKGDDRKILSGLSSEIKTVQIDFNSMKNSKITRIDGNHRLFFADKIEKDFLVPFCFVIFDQKGESSDIQTIHKNQEANIFYLLNGKNEPVTSEEALQVLLNMPDEEAQSLYQNDSTLGLTRICKEKYEKYLNACKEDAKRNFGDKIYTKFELLIKYIEKLGIENSKIDKLLDKVFSSINHLDEEYNAIISRDDFLYLVLNVVLDNQDKSSSKLNKLLKDFFDWILKEGLENISSSEKPILWELFQKQKSFKETSDIHSFEINENKFNGKMQETAYKEFILLVNESRKKIILKDIEEKRIGLEKIVDAYSKLLDIVGSGKPNNKQRVQSFIGQNFHGSGKPKLEAFLENYLYDVFGNNVMNNDFAIRHHETNKEKLEDKQFIEFLYCEYDNAIKFILDKAGFLMK